MNRLENFLPAGDLLLRTEPFHHTFFFEAIEPLARAMGPSGAAHPLYLLFTLLNLAGLYLLARRTCGSGLAAFVALSALLVQKTGPSGDWVSLGRGVLHPTDVAQVFFIFALERVLSGATVLPLLLIGLGSLVQAQYGLFILVAASAVIAAEWRKRGLRRILSGAAVFIAAASPLLIEVVTSPARPAGPVEMGPYLAAVRAVVGQHIYPGTWPYGNYIFHIVILVLGVHSLLLLPEPLRSRVGALSGATLLLAVLGTLAVHIAPSPVLLAIQPARCIKIPLLFAYLLIAGRLVSKGGYLSYIGLLGLILFPRLPALTAIMVILGLLPSRGDGDETVPAGRAAFAAILALVISVGWTFARPGRGEDTAWRETTEWIRENTPPDAVFVTPLDHVGFRLAARRSTVAEWRDGSPAIFSPDLEAEWWGIMNEFGIEEDPGEGLTEAYRSISEEGLEGLAAEFGASYILSEGVDGAYLPHAGGETVFENESYRVTRIVSSVESVGESTSLNPSSPAPKQG